MSNYDEIFYTETDQDEMDLAAHEEAHKILSGEIPSSPETYAMVQKFYGKADSVEQHPAEVKDSVRARRDHAMRTVQRHIRSRICPQI